MLVKLNTGRCGTAYDKNGRETGVFANQPGDEIEMPDERSQNLYRARLCLARQTEEGVALSQHLTKQVKTVVVSGNTSAGTTTVTSSAVDMQGYDAMRFIAYTGDATSGTVLTLTPLYNASNSNSGGTAITAGVATVTSASRPSDCDNICLISDVIRPGARYAYCTLARATQNCAVNGIIAELYLPKAVPITQDATVVASATAVQGGA
jgi:hypothetical protein